MLFVKVYIYYNQNYKGKIKIKNWKYIQSTNNNKQALFDPEKGRWAVGTVTVRSPAGCRRSQIYAAVWRWRRSGRADQNLDLVVVVNRKPVQLDQRRG